MSYARFDDQHDGGQLSEFREWLGAEVGAQTGQEFAIFQDRNDIAWGQNWQQRIDEALDEVTLLLVIITPSLFGSPPCRAEVARFLDRERVLGRGDLILPVYYISPLPGGKEKTRQPLVEHSLDGWNIGTPLRARGSRRSGWGKMSTPARVEQDRADLRSPDGAAGRMDAAW
jgi:hypothetical protein